jgi:hypothetical protein
MNSRDEGIIERPHSIGGQDENSVIELERTQKSWYISQNLSSCFSMGLSLPATRLLRAKSEVVRRYMKTSASSIKRTAPQLCALLKCEVKLCSTSPGSIPMSLLVSIISGRLVNAAMHSEKCLVI